MFQELPTSNCFILVELVCQLDLLPDVPVECDPGPELVLGPPISSRQFSVQYFLHVEQVQVHLL